MALALEFSGISKAFPGVQALSDVSFSASSHQVHAVMGENGAGKSTLLKVLSGDNRPDSGTLRIDGKEVRFRNTHEALQSGIAVIYQELQLVPDLTVAENVFLGEMPSKWGLTSFAKMKRETARILEWMGETIRPDARLGSLSIAQRQMVEIAKALSHDAKIIAFDEPTSSLGSKEVDRLFHVLDQLKNQGKVMLYVSHRMDEILKVCDAATVLRDGKHVKSFDHLEGVTADQLVELMVGRVVNTEASYRSREIGEVVMIVKDLTGPGVTAPASFDLHKGEILGFFGLVGAGRTELMKILAGAERATGGTVTLLGNELKRGNPTDRLKAGIGICPEDRKMEAINPVASVQDNLNLGVRSRFSRMKFWINNAKERENASMQAKRFGVRAAGLDALMRGLSGGNQQKVVLGRVLGHSLHVILLDEPTRGIDVGAKEEIHNHIRTLAEQGVATIVVSGEMPEILSLCDRILVMSEGRISGELTHQQASQVTLLEYALPKGE